MENCLSDAELINDLSRFHPGSLFAVYSQGLSIHSVFPQDFVLLKETLPLTKSYSSANQKLCYLQKPLNPLPDDKF